MNSAQRDVPNRHWSTNLEQSPSGQPLVTSNLLLVPTQEPGPVSHHATLHALDLADGSPRWQHPFEYTLISGLQTFAASILVSITSTDLMRGEGALIALDTAGQERWRWAPGVQHVSAPAVAENTACIAADAHTFVVLDAATGVERVRTRLSASASLSAPVTAGGVAYVPCRGPHLLAVGLDDRVRWRFDADDAPDAWLDKTPVVAKGHVFSALTTGTALALQATDGSLAWQAEVGPEGKPLSPPAIDGERLFVGARDGLHALDLDDGHEVWHFATERRITAAPVVGGSVVYVGCHDHHLYALDTATGEELWRYGFERRIEVSPAMATCGDPSTPCVLAADRGGTLTAIARPLGAEELEAAGQWREAASAYAAQGQFARGAELLEAHGEPHRAADLWEAVGERERAAKLYEEAGAWPQAAEIWAALGSSRQAEALALHARSLTDQSCNDEERAAAWNTAAQAFEAEGDAQRTAACRREAARWRKQPIITLDVQHEGLVLNAWSRLQFTVRNEGYGPARKLVIHASGDEFEGQVTTTRQISTLRAGHERTDWLDVRPLEYGKTVPLRLSVEYENQAGEACICGQTIYIPVARAEADRGAGQVLRIETGGGAVFLGDVAVRTSAPDGSPLPGTTHVLTFDRLSPVDFERLCLWLVEREGYTRGEHLGLAGSEQGRDVIAYKPAPQGEELWYFQCKRYASINAKTLKGEVDKYLQLVEEKPHLRPTGVVFVVSCAVSAKAREEAGDYCEQHGLAHEFWALTELDMRVKHHPDLLREFFNMAP
ncbi:MAG: PQQ-binding-like beta-propeller repeat protein [Anaerolineae bacterium]|nr:PQQ-binding-like beta-propeller repeat protein [Anaerolineae bacterium]